jgi:hypothetical protein
MIIFRNMVTRTVYLTDTDRHNVSLIINGNEDTNALKCTIQGLFNKSTLPRQYIVENGTNQNYVPTADHLFNLANGQNPVQPHTVHFEPNCVSVVFLTFLHALSLLSFVNLMNL